MATIQNDLITLSVNEAGQIEHLSMKGGPNIIARPTGLFRAILRTGQLGGCCLCRPAEA